jgi:hypothetical protein
VAIPKPECLLDVGAWLFGGYFNQWFRFLALLDLVGL